MSIELEKISQISRVGGRELYYFLSPIIFSCHIFNVIIAGIITNIIIIPFIIPKDLYKIQLAVISILIISCIIPIILEKGFNKNVKFLKDIYPILLGVTIDRKGSAEYIKPVKPKIGFFPFAQGQFVNDSNNGIINCNREFEVDIEDSILGFKKIKITQEEEDSLKGCCVPFTEKDRTLIFTVREKNVDIVKRNLTLKKLIQE